MFFAAKRVSISFDSLNHLKMNNNSVESSVFVPSHLSETLRYKTYTWHKKAVILKLASQVALNKSDHHSFLGYPLD